MYQQNSNGQQTPLQGTPVASPVQGVAPVAPVQPAMVWQILNKVTKFWRDFFLVRINYNFILSYLFVTEVQQHPQTTVMAPQQLQQQVQQPVVVEPKKIISNIIKIHLPNDHWNPTYFIVFSVPKSILLSFLHQVNNAPNRDLEQGYVMMPPPASAGCCVSTGLEN